MKKTATALYYSFMFLGFIAGLPFFLLGLLMDSIAKKLQGPTGPAEGGNRPGDRSPLIPRLPVLVGRHAEPLPRTED